jgi:demethylphylloquinone reductase
MNKRICILGGGFGGLYTALRLNELPWENSQKPEIVLIDQQDHFLFSPLLYELVTNEMQPWEIAPPFVKLLADTSVKFCQDHLTGIDFTSCEIQLAQRENLGFDKLVIALGGKTPLEGVFGVKDQALTFRTLRDAYRLQERLRELKNTNADKIRVAVVGGGYSGVELACKLADHLEKRGRIRLIERGEQILSNSPEFNRKTALQALEKRQIWIDLETQINSIESESMSLLYKGQVDTIPVDLVLWTVGNQVSELVQNLPLKHNQNGLLMTNSMLQVIDNPDIFALGDIADCKDGTGQKLPATAQVAFQQSDYCAWNIWASLTGRPLLPFRYQPLGEMMALGIDNATLNGLGIKFDGTLAYIARRLIYLYRLPTLQHQLNVGLNWITKPIWELLSTHE